MTATKTRSGRDLEIQRKTLSEQRATLAGESTAEGAVATAEAGRANGTGTVRDVSLAKHDVEQLRRELADKDSALASVDEEISALQAAQDARRLHAERIRRIVAEVEKGAEALGEFEKSRIASAAQLERALDAYQQQIEAQQTIANTIHELRDEGLSLDVVLKEIDGAGADLATVNVSFGTKRVERFLNGLAVHWSEE